MRSISSLLVSLSPLFLGCGDFTFAESASAGLAAGLPCVAVPLAAGFTLVVEEDAGATVLPQANNADVGFFAAADEV